MPDIPPSHSLKEDTMYRQEPVDLGLPGVLKLIPDLSAKGIGEEANRLSQRFNNRQAAFRRWERLIEMGDENIGPGIETMVSNDARTLLSLSVFLAASSEPRRTAAVGSQGTVAERRAGKSERAVSAWWQQIDERRIFGGQEPFRHALAYWLCLYGWYAVQYAAARGGEGEMFPVAVPLNPAECFPVFGDGLQRFVRRYSTTALEAQGIALQFGNSLSIRDGGQPVVIVDWYWQSPDKGVLRAVAVSGLRSGWQFLAEPHELDTERIPILVGRVGSRPGDFGHSETGSVLYENELVYRDSDKWVSYLMTHTKEVAQAPVVGHNLPELEEGHLRPQDLRSGGAVVFTDDPEARVERVSPAGGFIEVSTILSLIEARLQRGGFPYIVYGGLGRELSGFAISQLLQAAERKIGPQVGRMALIDSLISQHWLEQFKKGDFAPSTLIGNEEGNPRKFFVEEFGSDDVPKQFKILTEIPIRVGSDLMARVAIARQASGGAGPLLDQATIIGDILQMQDPTLILDGITRDAARQLVQPLKAAIELKEEAADLREKYGEAANEVIALIEKFAQQIILSAERAMGQQGAQAKMRVAPNEVPPEAFGVSPDVVRAARSEGPTNE